MAGGKEERRGVSARGLAGALLVAARLAGRFAAGSVFGGAFAWSPLVGASLAGALVDDALAADSTVPPPAAVPRSVRAALDTATVLVLPSRCAGVVVEHADLVATARHCVGGRDEAVRVRLDDGEEIAGRVVVVDDRTDQVIIRLRAAAAVDPLAIARRSLIRGTVLYFQGNPERPRPQDVRLDDIRTCGSLPDLPDAFFTSIRGTPGDSGAPVVDGGAEVVGLVHGGARCHIVTPAKHLLPLVRQAEAS